MKERWADISGWEGLYQASSRGRVRSLDRMGSDGRQWGGRVLKPGLASHGYLTVNLRYGQEGGSYTVHSLVASTFLGSREGLVVNHKDGDKLNNSLDNLEWCTRRENEAHKRDVLGKSGGGVMQGEVHPNSKLNDSRVRRIREMHQRGVKQKEIARIAGVGASTVSKVIRGVTWSHVK